MGWRKQKLLKSWRFRTVSMFFFFRHSPVCRGSDSVAFQECGDVASLNFLVGCTALRTLHFEGSNILNGDLSPILELSNLENLYVSF